MIARGDGMHLKHLLCVKSIMTIVLCIALVYLTIMYPDQYSDTFKSCVTMVVTFYFNYQQNKKQEGTEKQ